MGVNGIRYGVLFPAGKAQRLYFTVVDITVIYPKAVNQLALDDLILSAVRSVICKHGCGWMCINTEVHSLQNSSTLC